MADRPRRRLAAGRKTVVDVIAGNEKVTDSESAASTGNHFIFGTNRKFRNKANVFNESAKQFADFGAEAFLLFRII